MARQMRSIAWLSLLLGLSCFACGVLSGCRQPSGSGSTAVQVVPVSGTVTLEDEPLTDGFLYFKTIETGALERLEITRGRFQGNVQVGKRRVEICANRPRTVVIDGANVEVPDNIIHPSFNIESTLTAEVTPEGPNQFTFAVRRK